MRKLIFFLVFTLVLHTCTSFNCIAQKFKHIELSDVEKRVGLFYALPKTRIKVQVPVKKTIYKKSGLIESVECCRKSFNAVLGDDSPCDILKKILENNNNEQKKGIIYESFELVKKILL